MSKIKKPRHKIDTRKYTDIKEGDNLDHLSINELAEYMTLLLHKIIK